MPATPTDLELVKLDIAELFTRVSLHEALLEILLAEILASLPTEDSERYKAKVRTIGGRLYGPITADPQAIERMQQDTARFGAMLDRVLAKIAERERDVRAGRTAQPPSPRPRS